VNPTIDEIFKQVSVLSRELDALGEDDPLRDDLINTRDRLRADAQRIAESARHPLSVEAEISMLLSRLAEIDALFVTKGYAEKHLTKGFSDPGAYSAVINRKMADDHAGEISEIEERLSVLSRIKPSDPAP
jgi:hypothetical protein